MIEPTREDIGRRVRMTRWPHYVGKLFDERPCGFCRGPCCKVHFENERFPVLMNPNWLEWADHDLL